MPRLLEDTIAAISTPLGKSGIGVVRLSGPQSRSILAKLFRRQQQDLGDRRPVLGEIVDSEKGESLDQVMVTCFLAPRSYTREDVVEISCHGSPVLLRSILQLLIREGARLATPGEFTLRAFLRGRIDLLQAEAIRDLIEAQTLFQARVARQQAAGGLSRRVQPIKERLIQLIALLEAGIDFAEDDVAVPGDNEIGEQMNTIRGDLGRLEATFAAGRLINEGFSLAIVGRPNVGKSSLFNALLKEERAIVTELPGTTRDLVAETAQLGGIPVRLMDTAGIREVTDRIEQLGVDRSREALADAEQVLLVLDGSEELQTEDGNLLEELEGRSYHLVINKIDLPQRLTPDTLKTSARTRSLISVRTGEGVEALRATLLRDLELEQAIESEGGLLTNLRQEQEVRSSLESLDRVKQGLAENLPHEILLLDLYRALKSLNALTGETTVEDILDHIFSKFCIGK